MTVTVVELDMVASCVDMAVMVAVPVVVGVKTPVLLTVPMLDGLRDQVTALLKLPVPLTVAVQADVCVVRMEAGEQATETDVIVGAEVGVEAEPPLPEPPQPKRITAKGASRIEPNFRIENRLSRNTRF